MIDKPEPILTADQHVRLAVDLAVQQERMRIADYIRAMGEPASGYYSTLRRSVDSPVTVSIMFNRLSTDIKLGEHVKPKTTNPELWK